MLRPPEQASDVTMTPVRITALDRARTFITLLVVLHHSVLNYTYFGTGDRARWIGFDLVVLFNDSFFMACMFLISGLFVRDSLARRGPADFLRYRAVRLGVPYLISIFILMPIAYYPTFLRYHLPGTTDFNFVHFWWRTLTIGPWPSGPAWFLWVLLALDAITAAIWAMAPDAIAALGRAISSFGKRPLAAFAVFAIFSVIIYLPLHLIFGDSAWFEPGPFPLPIQTSRVLLYAGYFFVGVGIGATNLRAGLFAEGGELANRWGVWLGAAMIFYGGILVLVYAHHHWVADFNAPPLWWRAAYGIAFALFSAAMTLAVPTTFVYAARLRLDLLDAIQPSAYGIFLLHYIFIIWLQYNVYDPVWSAFLKFSIVFFGTLSLSWATTLSLRRIPIVARVL
jgi:surface polysaccharide O-acyltransferase-like enzyme